MSSPHSRDLAALPSPRDGFALVVAISLAAFLLLLVLSLAALTGVSAQSARTTQDVALARSNAKVGLAAALNQLQIHAGPDRRVTAQANLLSPTGGASDHWTGVWHNPVPPTDPANTLQRDLSRRSAPVRLTWLISGEVDTTGSPAFVAGETTVPLAVLPEADGSTTLVEAALATIPTTLAQRDTGAYAYWVNDEGVKAMINLDNPHRSGLEQLLSFQSAQRLAPEAAWPTLGMILGPDAPNPLSEMLARMRSRNELPLLSGDPLLTSPHITLFSAGVQADALNGGLKRDLSLAFEADDNAFGDMVDFAAPDTARPLTEPTALGGGAEPHYRRHITASQPNVITTRPDGTPNQTKYLFYEAIDTDDIVTDMNNFPNAIPPGPAIPAAYTNPAEADGGFIRGNTWHQLRDYYRSYQKVQNRFGAATLPAQIPEFWDSAIYAYTRTGLVTDGLSPFPAFNTYASDLLTQRQYNEQTGWRPISRPLGNPIMPVLVRERWIHSIIPRQGASPNLFTFDVVVIPILTFWNPYNVSLEVEAIDFEKFHPVNFMEIGIFPNRETGSMSMGSRATGHWFDKVALNAREMVEERFPDINLDNVRPPWSFNVRLRGNGGTPITFAPGEIKVFSVTPGAQANYDPDAPTRRLLLELNHVTPADMAALSTGGNGFFFENVATLNVLREPVNAADLATIEDSPGHYNPLFFVYLHEGPGSANYLNSIHLHRGGERILTARHWSAFVQGERYARTQGQQRLEAFPLHGAWPDGLIGDTNALSRNNDEFIQDLLDEQNTIYSTDFFLKPENYIVVYNDGNRNWGAFPVPLTSHFNPTAPVHWITTGVRSPHPVSDIWDGSSTVLYDFNPVGAWGGMVFLDADSRGYLGQHFFSSPESSYKVVLREVPLTPLLSLGSLRHANLSLYEHQPLYTVGESFPSPYVGPERVWEAGPYRARPYDNPGTTQWLRRGGSQVPFTTIVDWTYLTNEALWDRFYFSGIAPSPLRGTSLAEELDAFLNGNTPLANSRTVVIPGRETLLEQVVDNSGQVTAFGSGDTPWPTAAIPSVSTFVNGAFNINSTSVEAWTMLLGATLGVDVQRRQGNSINNIASEVAFPRQSVPYFDSSEPQTWQNFRQLSRDDIVDLAEHIVDEIRLRGPFTSLADFVNRRLANDDTALAGTLQAAIDASTINNAFNQSALTRNAIMASNTSPMAQREPSLAPDFPYPDHLRGGYLRQGATRYLTQGDLLQVLGPALSARSDTFTIRCYGQLADPVTGEIKATAIGEAVVQRFPDPVTPSTYEPFEPDNPERFGRQFRIIAFQWLSDT